MYAVATQDRAQRFGAFIAVRTIEDLRFLIKEGELITGRAGREFVMDIGGARRTLCARFDGTAYGLSDATREAIEWLLEDELLRSAFGAALQAGQVFAVQAQS